MKLSFQSVFFTITVLTLLLSTIKSSNGDDTSCPSLCTCDAEKVKCSGSDTIPTFEKGDIKYLILSPNNLTEIKAGDFAGYDKLEQLDLSQGKISAVAPGSFDDISDTIVRIVLSGNTMSDTSPVNVFKNLKNLNKIELDNNKMTVLANDTFVNLPKLATISIESNILHFIESDAIKEVPALENVHLEGNHFSFMPFDALRKVQALTVLDLKGNRLLTLEEHYHDVYFPSLKDLNLATNPIDKFRTFPNISMALETLDLQFTLLKNFTVAPNTWKNVPNLKSLDISGSLTTEIVAGTFDGLSNLEKLYLQNSPHLKTIGAGVFSSLEKLHTLIISNNKFLVYINETAFNSNPNALKTVNLRNNGFEHVQKELLNWSALENVTLTHNPFKCDCKLAWMLDTSITAANPTLNKTFSSLTCHTPAHLTARKILSLDQSELVCKAEARSHMSRLATGVIVAMCCLAFMIIVFVLVRSRDRITMSVRKFFQYRRYKNELIFTVENDTSIAELDETDGRLMKDMRLETVPLEA